MPTLTAARRPRKHEPIDRFAVDLRAIRALLADGMTPAEIRAAMGISERTYRNRMAALRAAEADHRNRRGIP